MPKRNERRINVINVGGGGGGVEFKIKFISKHSVLDITRLAVSTKEYEVTVKPV